MGAASGRSPRRLSPVAFGSIPGPETYSLVTSPTTGGVRNAAAAILLIIFAIFIGIMPVVTLLLPAVPPFLPVFSTSIIIGDLLTCLTLLQQARLTRRPGVVMLSCSYLFTALICGFQLLVIPDAFTPDGLFANGSNGAIFLWIVWHVSLPLFIAAYAFLETSKLLSRASSKGLAWISALPVPLFLAVVAFVLLAPKSLPTLTVNGSFRASSLDMASIVVTCNLLAVLVLPWRTHLKHRLEVWLWVAAVASLLDVTVTLASGARYSLGWYMARLYVALVKLNNQLARMVSRDGLTGLANRRHFDAVLSNEWQRCQRQQAPVSFLMVDVDHFKHFNDSLGHPAGDACLRMVAATLAKIVGRPADLVARYGGEEFCLLLPGTTFNGAMTVAERTRLAIGAFYAAKRIGRNRCVHSDALPPEPEPETEEQSLAAFRP